MPPIEGDADGAIDFIDDTKLEYGLDVSLLGEITRMDMNELKRKWTRGVQVCWQKVMVVVLLIILLLK